MASFNRVILVGNLTRDPELRYISSGTAVSDITLAVNERVKRNEQWVEEVNFIDVTLWARTAEVANEYLSKGSSILIEGRLKLDRWEKEGQKHSKLRVVCEKMQMLGGRDAAGGGNRMGSAQRSGGQPQPSQEESYSGDDYESGAPSPAGFPPDEIPF